MDEDQFYVHLYSNSSDQYFPDNKPYDFTSMLPEPISLHGRWFCALTEIEYTRKNTNDDTPLHLAIFADICKASITGNEKTTLLRHIPLTRGQRILYAPASTNYVVVSKCDIDRIHVWIRCPDSSPEALFESKPSRVTLHFCKGPPMVL